MSNIAELANCPELSFIESMTLQETEEQLRELYTKYYREATGKEPEIGEADPLNLLMKAFCAMEYQTMQYADAKGRMEMLKTSTGDALDALAALVGLTRKEANRATATVRTNSKVSSGGRASRGVPGMATRWLMGTDAGGTAMLANWTSRPARWRRSRRLKMVLKLYF